MDTDNWLHLLGAVIPVILAISAFWFGLSKKLTDVTTRLAAIEVAMGHGTKDTDRAHAKVAALAKRLESDVEKMATRIHVLEIANAARGNSARAESER